MPTHLFNIRVYGILIAEERVLVTDEYRMGRSMTKLPGGGLQFGEGTIDAVKREFQEELGILVQVQKHFYTTDYFQPSAFNSKQQVLSIYYIVSTEKPGFIPARTERNSFDEIIDGAQIFRWVALKDLTIGEFTFQIDQKVASLLIDQYRP